VPYTTSQERSALEWYLLDLTDIVNRRGKKTRNFQPCDTITVLEGYRERRQTALPHRNQRGELVLKNPGVMVAGCVGGLLQST
jgi:hypothetical protein